MPPKVGQAMEKVAAGKGSNKRKGKKKKEKEQKQDPNSLTEVDKTFYELQITDLNRKLARLRSLVTELEVKNEELTKQNSQLDEDRADVIAYLKRSLLEKENEIKELQERLKGLEETRQTETEKYEEKIKELEQEYKNMHEQLTSEIKLLQGKLNSLEEFRIQRDEIMKKYDEQEKAMEEQEVRHKREIYEIERKFIIGKDKLKKEMEARLLQLSTDFQDATEVRIASTTHRVIRENIAINNELNLLLETVHRLQEENEQLKSKNTTFRLEAELHNTEKKKTIRKAKVQKHLIEKMCVENDKMKLAVQEMKKRDSETDKLKLTIEDNKKEIDDLTLNLKIMEQNLHSCRCECLTLKNDFEYYYGESNRLLYILCAAVKSIKAALRVQHEQVDEAEEISRREDLLINLLQLLSTVEDTKLRKPSLQSIESASAAYFKGDLGLIPRPQILKVRYPINKNIYSQVGESFEEFLTLSRPSKLEELRLKEGETESEAQLRIISDPDMLRHILKERQMRKDAEAIAEAGEIESVTFFMGEQEVSEESEEAVDVTDLEISPTFGVELSELMQQGLEAGEEEQRKLSGIKQPTVDESETEKRGSLQKTPSTEKAVQDESSEQKD